MWKQNHYPAFEDSEYLGARHNWRYAFSASVITMLVGLATAYYVIDSNDGFNRPFGEPARAVRGTALLTNSLAASLKMPSLQNVFVVEGLDVFALTKDIPAKVNISAVKQVIPQTVVEQKESPALPEVREPVTAPRIMP